MNPFLKKAYNAGYKRGQLVLCQNMGISPIKIKDIENNFDVWADNELNNVPEIPAKDTIFVEKQSMELFDHTYKCVDHLGQMVYSFDNIKIKK